MTRPYLKLNVFLIIWLDLYCRGMAQEEEEEMDTSSLMLIVVYTLGFVTPYFRKIYVEFFTAEGAALRKKQVAEKKARKDSKKLRKESKKISIEMGNAK